MAAKGLEQKEIQYAVLEACKEGERREIHPDLLRGLESLARASVDAQREGFRFLAHLIVGLQEIQDRMDTEEKAREDLLRRFSADWN